MKHPDENILERFILNPEKFSVEESAAIRGHMDSCFVCREIEGFLRTFHDDVKRSGYTPTQRVDEFVRALFPRANVIPLYPLRMQPLPSSAESKYTTVLAAMTDTDDHRRFHTLATFGSEAENTVVRVTHDRKLDTLKLYVYSDDPDRSKHAIISLPELSADLVADQNGQLSLAASSSLGKQDWKSLKPILRTTVAEYTIQRIDLLTASQARPWVVAAEAGSAPSLKSWCEGETMIMQITSTDELFFRALVLYSQDKRILVNLDSGVGRCTLDPSAESITIRLYH